MDTATAQLLCQLNNDFYRTVSASFSATRQAPWTGWHRCAELLLQHHQEVCGNTDYISGNDVSIQCKEDNACEGSSVAMPYRVADIACGNLRFESFVLQECARRGVEPLVFHAADQCLQLLPESPDMPFDMCHSVQFEQIDIVDAIIRGTCRQALERLPRSEAVVSFGFMHHVPDWSLRMAFLKDLIDMTKPGGLVMVSLWQFMKNETLARKAQSTQASGLAFLADKGLQARDLESGDYLLGWKDAQDVYRYCHHFSSEEIDALVDAVASEASLVERFETDGRSQNLNTYLVFRKQS